MHSAGTKMEYSIPNYSGKYQSLLLKTQANLWQQEFGLVLDNLCVKDLDMDTMVSSAATALTKTVIGYRKNRVEKNHALN